ncbi:hypothetical protein EB118_22550 [bacterium]|nr:hypothetical protein [bacterium]
MTTYVLPGTSATLDSAVAPPPELSPATLLRYPPAPPAPPRDPTAPEPPPAIIKYWTITLIFGQVRSSSRCNAGDRDERPRYHVEGSTVAVRDRVGR